MSSCYLLCFVSDIKFLLYTRLSALGLTFTIYQYILTLFELIIIHSFRQSSKILLVLSAWWVVFDEWRVNILKLVHIHFFFLWYEERVSILRFFMPCLSIVCYQLNKLITDSSLRSCLSTLSPRPHLVIQLLHVYSIKPTRVSLF